jgi:hypothetical protein
MTFTCFTGARVTCCPMTPARPMAKLPCCSWCNHHELFFGSKAKPKVNYVLFSFRVVDFLFSFSFFFFMGENNRMWGRYTPRLFSLRSLSWNFVWFSLSLPISSLGGSWRTVYVVQDSLAVGQFDCDSFCFYSGRGRGRLTACLLTHPAWAKTLLSRCGEISFHDELIDNR